MIVKYFDTLANEYVTTTAGRIYRAGTYICIEFSPDNVQIIDDKDLLEVRWL